MSDNDFSGSRNRHRYLVLAGATELIEGGPEPKRIVILEFADTAAFKLWYSSPEYQEILPTRLVPSFNGLLGSLGRHAENLVRNDGRRSTG